MDNKISCSCGNTTILLLFVALIAAVTQPSQALSLTRAQKPIAFSRPLLRSNLVTASFHPVPAASAASDPADCGVALYQSKDDRTEGYSFESDTDGTGRGIYILVIVFFLNLWLFSIPPEFRRANICSQTYCEQNPKKFRGTTNCGQCTSFDEWKEGVASYYRNGGGVKFDFSIDPRTLESNRQAWEKKFGSK